MKFQATGPGDAEIYSFWKPLLLPDAYIIDLEVTGERRAGIGRSGPVSTNGQICQEIHGFGDDIGVCILAARDPIDIPGEGAGFPIYAESMPARREVRACPGSATITVAATGRGIVIVHVDNIGRVAEYFKDVYLRGPAQIRWHRPEGRPETLARGYHSPHFHVSIGKGKPRGRAIRCWPCGHHPGGVLIGFPV